MGENSARQMRGDGMDDIIFAGTSERPARNFAEVSIKLDNSERKAPANFNHLEEIEISRKIEREKGSIYRVNSKQVRARDVQLIFADNGTGADHRVQLVKVEQHKLQIQLLKIEE